MREVEATEFSRLFIGFPKEHDPARRRGPPHDQLRRPCENFVRQDLRSNLAPETFRQPTQKGQGERLRRCQQRSAFSLADDVVILNTGRVVFAGPVEAVRDNAALITQHLGVF